MEYKRTILNFKFILIAVVLLLFGTCNYYSMLSEDEHFKSYNEFAGQVEQNIAQGQDIDVFLQNKYDEIQELYYTAPDAASVLDDVVKEVIDYWDYLKNYHEENEYVIKQSQRLLEKQQSNAQRAKIEKTLRDFAELSKVSVEFGNEYAVTSVMDYKIINYILLLIAVIIVFNFFDERKRGMWSFVHTTYRGRFSLAVRRCAIASIVTVALSVLAYAAIFLITWNFTGTPDMQQSIQSIRVLGEFPFTVTIGQWLAIFVAVRVLGILLGMFSAYLLLSIFNNRTIGLLIFAVIFAFEAILYNLIGYNSNLTFLRTYNFYGMICENEWLTAYNSVALFWKHAVLFQGLIIALMLLGIVALVAGIIIINGRKMPSKSTSIMSIIMETQTMGKLMEHIPSWLEEYRKVFVWSGGIVIMIIIMIISVNGKHEASFPYKFSSGMLQSIYRNLDGRVDSAEEIVGELKQELKTLDSSDIKYSYVSDTILELEKRINYTLKQQEEGYIVYVLDDTPYTAFFGKKQRQINKIIFLVETGALILILGNLYSFEQRKGTQKYINATAHGKYKLIRDKSILTILTTVSLYGIVTGRNIYLHWYNYGFPNFSYHIRNVTLFGKSSINIKIGDAVIIQLVAGLALLLLIGFAIGFISKKLSAKGTMAVSAAVFMLPAALELLGVTWCRYLSVATLADIANYIL